MFPLVLLLLPLVTATNEWKYDKDMYGGQYYWGQWNTTWGMCSKGKLQSPIDIEPDKLLFDPGLAPILITRTSVASELVNTGHMPRVRIGNSKQRMSANLSGGPLNNYRFQVQRIDVHFGRSRDHNGSEHSIDKKKFPMELQLLAFNTDLYSNFSMALHSPNGLAAVAVLVDIGPQTHDELMKLTVATSSVLYRNKRVELADFKPFMLLPPTRDFVTYQGSLTIPGCEETVTWIIVNQPIHITEDHLAEWGKMKQTTEEETNKVEPQFLGPNSRSLREGNGRLLRTNIQHRTTVHGTRECKVPVAKLSYRSNVQNSQHTLQNGVSERLSPFVASSKSQHRQHRRRHATEVNHDTDLLV